MSSHWNATNHQFEISKMPFYWRLSQTGDGVAGISQTLPIRISVDSDFDYLKFEPSEAEWATIERAYQQNENIGFVNPVSGQLQTYGSSVNNFFKSTISRFNPASIYEIGCGAGFTIKFLKEKGWDVTGIDPSEYSLRKSEQLGFKLINAFFGEGILDQPADFIYCNDVFAHVPAVGKFCKLVYENLRENGVFCFATTNATQSILIGDISMFGHQHVNMFTERSIHLILREAGFTDIEIRSSSYGGTIHVTASKNQRGVVTPLPSKDAQCAGYIDRAKAKVEAFGRFYAEADELHCYVPVRSIPYLACVGDFGRCTVYDSNAFWREKFIDGYASAIRGPDDVKPTAQSKFFIASLTFHDEIKAMLIQKGFTESSIFSISDLV
jgi:SAM-dependent methyltransferase